jgi:general secretion pathway protein N
VARAADGGSNLGDLELTGIILTPGLRMVLLHDKNGDKQVRLHEGEALPDGSVKLVEVRPRSALFDSSAGRTELKLPAGAPIDNKPPATANTAPGTGTIMQVEPGAAPMGEPGPQPGGTNMGAPQQRPAPNPAVESAAQRLRQNIQKRRAARAAAANEGVR